MPSPPSRWAILPSAICHRNPGNKLSNEDDRLETDITAVLGAWGIAPRIMHTKTSLQLIHIHYIHIHHNSVKYPPSYSCVIWVDKTMPQELRILRSDLWGSWWSSRNK